MVIINPIHTGQSRFYERIDSTSTTDTTWILSARAVDNSARFQGKIITLHTGRDMIRATCFGRTVGTLARISDGIFEGRIFGLDVRIEPGTCRGVLRIFVKVEVGIEICN